ncbi:MAG: hypothetical protein H0X17_11260 [Deltaproteobacteria bacterium]|nr:hypothetical protein [Deltaproteobacteria bacterium]
MLRRLGASLAALLLAASCGKQDNSQDTDKPSEDLRKAQSELKETSKAVTENQAEIEQRQRDLLKEQQELADKQKLLDQQRHQLGSAQQGLEQARAAYGAAIKQRLAKLDASLATLATRTDPKSRDAVTGLRARREQLAIKLAAMPGTADASWSSYTKDVDLTFDAIEDDVNAVGK